METRVASRRSSTSTTKQIEFNIQRFLGHGHRWTRHVDECFASKFHDAGSNGFVEDSLDAKVVGEKDRGYFNLLA